MIRRSIDDGELAFYHCYNPNHAGFAELVHEAGARGTVAHRRMLECVGIGTSPWPCSHIHTFLAVTAHKAKKRRNTPTRRTGQRIHRRKTPGEPPEPEIKPPIYKRLIALTLAEIRRLLDLVHSDDRAIDHGLHWSI